MSFPNDLKYSNGHDWIRLASNNEVYLGMTYHVQRLMGEIILVEIKRKGQHYDKNQEYGSTESVKVVSNLYMPVSGTILEINANVVNDVTLLESDPYGTWIIKIKLSNPAELADLMDAAQYALYLQ